LVRYDPKGTTREIPPEWTYGATFHPFRAHGSLNRIGCTEEIAEVIVFVATVKAFWLTGQMGSP